MPFSFANSEIGLFSGGIIRLRMASLRSAE
jgi:hypothetical protein